MKKMVSTGLLQQEQWSLRKKNIQKKPFLLVLHSAYDVSVLPTLLLLLLIIIIITFISIVKIQQFSFQMRLTTSTLQDMYSSKILNVYKNIKKKSKD